MPEVKDLTLDQLELEVRKLRLQLQAAAQRPSILRVNSKWYDIILENLPHRYIQVKGDLPVNPEFIFLGLAVKFWEDEEVQVETEALLGRFVRAGVHTVNVGS